MQNVVTYDAVIDVENPDLKLKPGMTANVTVVYAEREDALRVPERGAALPAAPDLLGALGRTSAAPGRVAGRDGGARWRGGRRRRGGAWRSDRQRAARGAVWVVARAGPLRRR